MRAWVMGSIVLVASLSVVAGDYGTWSKDHGEAKAALLRVLNNHEKAKNGFCDWEADAPGQPRELIEFLVEKGDRNVGDFLDKVGKEGKTLRKLHTDHPEAMRGFRNWLRDNPNAARDLAKLSKPFKALCDEAETTVKNKKKKKDK